MTVLEMRQQRAALYEELVKLNTTAEGRALSDEEQARWNTLRSQMDALKALIEREEFIDAEGNDLRRAINRPPVDGVANGGRSENRFGSFGEFLIGVANAARSNYRNIDPRLEIRATGMSEGVPSDGGFLVQTEQVNELLKRVYEVGPVANRCRRIPVGANANGIAVPYVKESHRTDGNRWGGIRGYWSAEAATLTASKPTFGKLRLDLDKITLLAYATDELLQDAAALESVISQAAQEELIFKLEDGIINGSGAGMPQGIIGAGCTVSVAKETGQAAATVLTENIVKMWARCYGRSRQSAVWLINQDIEPQLYTMSLAVGTGGIPVYMPANGLSSSPYGALFGRPVLPIEYAATLGTVGDVILADLSQYILIEKGGIQAASSMHVQFLTDEMVFRFIYRVNGQPWWSTTLTPFKGSNTQSPFVTLATRA